MDTMICDQLRPSYRAFSTRRRPRPVYVLEGGLRRVGRFQEHRALRRPLCRQCYGRAYTTASTYRRPPLLFAKHSSPRGHINPLRASSHPQHPSTRAQSSQPHQPPNITTMFAKLTSAFAALAILAVATSAAPNDAPPASSCSTGTLQCCSSVQSSDSSAIAPILAALGIVLQDVNVPIGLGCSGITGVGVGGSDSW